MFKKIGTRALKCKHGNLIGVEECHECEDHPELPNVRPTPVVSPMQNIGMSVQSSLEQLTIPIHRELSFYPVWAGTMEEMSEGRMVFGLQTGHPREDYEDPPFQLVVKMKIKHTVPWWKRLWNRLTRRRPKPWEQQRGFFYRSDGKGGSVKVMTPDRGYAPKMQGSVCPNCQNHEFRDHSLIEQWLGGGKILTCTNCNCTYYYDSVAEEVG
jgi:hypothetical protein